MFLDNPFAIQCKDIEGIEHIGPLRREAGKLLVTVTLALHDLKQWVEQPNAMHLTDGVQPRYLAARSVGVATPTSEEVEAATPTETEEVEAATIPTEDGAKRGKRQFASPPAPPTDSETVMVSGG